MIVKFSVSTTRTVIFYSNVTVLIIEAFKELTRRSFPKYNDTLNCLIIEGSMFGASFVSQYSASKKLISVMNYVLRSICSRYQRLQLTQRTAKCLNRHITIDCCGHATLTYTIGQ